MQFEFGTHNKLGQQTMKQLFSYRYGVFVDRLGWELPDATPGREVDQFDRHDTIHVIGRRSDGTIAGTARLLPTTKPYLLSSVFPELMAGQDIPAASDIWEISRFASVDLDQGVVSGQADYWGCRAVMAATVACAMELGARRLIGVSVMAIERILKRLGVHAHRAGPVMRLHGHKVFAFWLEIDDQTLDALGVKPLASQPVINNRFCDPERMAYFPTSVQSDSYK